MLGKGKNRTTDPNVRELDFIPQTSFIYSLPYLSPMAFILFYFWLCWVRVAAQGLSLVVRRGGYSLVAAHRLLIVVASLFVVQGLQSLGSVVVTHRLSGPATCGILLDQGSNLCPLH